MRKSSTKRTLSGLLLSFLLIATACGSSTNATDDSSTDASDDTGSTTSAATDETTAPADPGEESTLEGSFLVSGSSTVFPIVQRQAEEFAGVAPGVAISVEGPGSGDGAKKFCAGEVPIANASRLFKDEEIAICEEAGIEFIEIRRGIDGISLVTSADNDAIECLSFNQIYALLSDETIGFSNWSDANALLAAMGSTADDLPDAQLDIFGPGEESGTFDSFGEIVLEAVANGKTGLDADAREFVDIIRPDYTSSPDDNVIIEGISSSQYSLGWVGFAFASEAAATGKAKLIAVSKEDGGECVTPTAETIASAEFPIARFLYTYVNVESAASDPSVAAFVDYMLSDTGYASVSAVGYIDMPAEDIDKANSIWADRTSGRSWE